jgi:hypothetical protein
MRKRDPNDVIDQFRAEIAAARSDRISLIAGATLPLARRATMDAFTRAAVAFERFRSDWHLAAVTRDANTFKQWQLNRVKAALTETKRVMLIPYVRVDLPPHPTLAQVEELLDASGGNISLSSIDDWKKRAKAHLAPAWAAKVSSISWADARIADAVIKTRNAASHQSKRAVGEMNDALTNLTDPVAHKGLARPTHRVSVTGIPAYLHGSQARQPPRVETYLDALDRLAGHFWV